MRIKSLSTHRYEIPLSSGQLRRGVLIKLIDENENESWGEIAPLPKWSKESLEDALQQLNQKLVEITNMNWTAETYVEKILKLSLLPSVSFGLESAILSILLPLSNYTVPSCALLMGSFNEILDQAELRFKEGYISAKLKVSNLSFEEAHKIICDLKDKFRLRIDVNRAWNTSESMQFFAKYSLDSFDYVEEPFLNPHDLGKFLHPLAVDESFPQDLSLEELETFPTLKALIYKPTIQGGIASCQRLLEWGRARNLDLVLSSSFESDLGLACVASIAHRLGVGAPVGLGTYHFLKRHICSEPLQFIQSFAHIPARLTPPGLATTGVTGLL